MPKKIQVALRKPFSFVIQCSLCTVSLRQGFAVHNSAYNTVSRTLTALYYRVFLIQKPVTNELKF